MSNSKLVNIAVAYNDKGEQVRKFTTYKPPAGVTPGKAEKLANEYAVLWEEKIRGYVSLDENRTFRELAEWYYENVAPTTLKENIMIDNRDIIQTYIIPSIGREKLKNITPQMLDTLFRKLATEGRVKDVYKLIDVSVIKRGTKSDISRQKNISRHTIHRACAGKCIERENAQKIADYLGMDFKEVFVTGVDNRELAPASVSRIRRCLSAIFTSAVKKEIMRRNPVAHTEIIKREHTVESYMDEEQALKLLEALDEHNNFQFRVMITTLLFTGMRGGELCGLQWDGLDLEKNIIHIRATLAYNRGNKTRGKEKYTLQAPKTSSSKRYNVIPESLTELLKEHKKQQEERRVAFGSDWLDRGTVFCTVNGDYYSESYLNAQFKRLVRKIGLPDDLHIHSLRHTTASLLINDGVSAKAVADQLGHAKTTITNDLYAHIFESSKVKNMQVLEMKLMHRNSEAAPDEERL